MVVLPGNRYKTIFERILKNNPSGENGGQVVQRYLENYEVFSERCRELRQADLAEFGKYVLQNSYIAVLRAEDQIQALLIFAILNDRGIDLHPVDILKANILEKLSVSRPQKVKFSESWEEYEEKFDRKRFQDLIGHIRMTYIRGRTQNPLHEDLLSRLKSSRQAESFLKDEPPSFVLAFDHILNTEDVTVRNLAEIGRRAGFKDWEAPALFVTRKRAQLKSTYKQVIREIAGIVVVLSITKTPDGQRAGRFGRMINDLEKLVNGDQKIGDLESLKVSRLEWQAFEGALRADAYSIRGLRAALLWLEAISGDDDRSVESSEVTIEHVLPRKSGDEAFWLERFSEPVWKENSNRLGNLLLVSGRSNTQMARKAFMEKMEYINKKDGSSWIWTQDALKRGDWNLDIVQQRENLMIDKMRSRLKFE